MRSEPRPTPPAARGGVERLASYVIWLTVSGLLVVGIEALSRTV
jgi:hypothetical protein